MSIIDTARADYDKAIDGIKSWFPEFEQRAGKVAEAASAELQKFEGNQLAVHIVEQDLHVPAPLLPLAVDFLAKLGTAAETLAAAQSQPAAPADPAPADTAPATT